ncbi:MAG TPA: hypothetical protein ENI23_05815 [bacterium]|nr:hypothetical protein [bacterium]
MSDMTPETGEDDYTNKPMEVLIKSGKLTVIDPADPIPELEGEDPFLQNQMPQTTDQADHLSTEEISGTNPEPETPLPSSRFKQALLQTGGFAALITLTVAFQIFWREMRRDFLEIQHKARWGHTIEEFRAMTLTPDGTPTPTPTIEP